MDILPTILEWLGRPVPDQCDGRSLMPFIEGATPPDWRTDVHYELDFRTSPNSRQHRSGGGARHLAR